MPLLRGLDTGGKISAIFKGGNFCDFRLIPVKFLINLNLKTLGFWIVYVWILHTVYYVTTSSNER